MFGAAQELPWLLAPLSFVTLGSHWSLLRAHEHYPSDILAGGALAFAVAGRGLEGAAAHHRRDAYSRRP